MALWSETLGVTLDFNDLTPEQIENLVKGIDKEKHDKLMAELDVLIASLKEHKEVVKLARRVLSIFILKLISV